MPMTFDTRLNILLWKNEWNSRIKRDPDPM
jgi:hypothetical protein